MKPAAGLAVTVRQFRFAGNTLLTDAQLAPVVASYLERPLDFAQLQGAAAAVASAYREAGWIVRVYLPQQDIRDGIVTLQIVEAVFGGLHFEGVSPRRIDTAQIRRGFEAQQKQGEALNADALDRALLLMNDLPGVVVSGRLQEGKGERETDITVKLSDEPLLVGEATLDNAGSRSTGAERLSASANFNSPFGLGDLLSGNAVHTQGSNYLRLGYSLPVGADGWRIGVNASRLTYRLVSAEFKSLDGRGSSSVVGIDATYPLIRSRQRNLYLILGHDWKDFDNRLSGVVSSRYQLEGAMLGLSGNLFDNLGGGGANSASLGLVSGKLDLDGSPNQAADAATTRSQGRFAKLRYALSRQQVITESVSLLAALSGQAASKNLDSAEKFYLGGAHGVRAYPSNEGGGSEGYLFKLELRWRVIDGLVLAGFHDRGQVTVNRNNDFVGAAVPNRYRLMGNGLSADWQTSMGFNLKATWAHRMGNNPNPTATGTDQDGSLNKNRFWLVASAPF